MSVLSDMQKVIDKIIDHIDKTLTKGSVTNTQVASVLHFLNETQKKLWNKIKKVSESSLSKKEPDTAEEPITFAKGLTTLNAIIQDLAEAKKLSVSEVAEIAKLVISGEIKSKDYSDNDGFKIFRGENGWSIEIDNIVARKTFKTLEIVVQRAIHQGGQIIQSPAGGTLVRYERENPAMWVFKVDSSEDFEPGDFVLCQTFSAGKTKRYWRLVDNYYPESKTIFIHKNDREEGSDIPEVGDEIVVLGHKRNPARQNARIISVIGENSPYTADYKGINNYSLRGKLINQIGNLTGIEDPAFGGPLQGVGTYTNNLYAKGIFRFSSGERVEDYINTKTNQAKEQAVTLANNAVNGVKEELNNTLETRLGGKELKKTIDATALDENRFYPVMIWLNGQKRSKITVYRPLGSQYNRNNSTVPPSYSSHQQGFYTKLVWEVTGSGWGTAQESRDVISYEKNFFKENQWAVGDIHQMHQLTCEIIYIRGGSKYDFIVTNYSPGAWVNQFFPEGAEPIHLYSEGYTYEQNIKDNDNFGGYTYEQRAQFFGSVNYSVKTSVTEPITTLNELKSDVDKRYVTKSVHSADIEATNNKISQKVNRSDFDQHNVKLAEHTSVIQQLATSISQSVKKTDFDDLGRRVGTTESLIRQSAGRFDLLVTKTNEQDAKIEGVKSSVENARTELKEDATNKSNTAKKEAITASQKELNKAQKTLEDGVSSLRRDLGATKDEVLNEAGRRLNVAKEEMKAKVKEDVKAGITADDNGNITVLGKQIALIGTTLAERIVVQGLTAKIADVAQLISDNINAKQITVNGLRAGIAEVAQFISDNIRTKKIEVRVGDEEVALIDATNGIARFGNNTKMGNFYIQGSNIMSLNKSSKIELDYSAQGKVAHLSTEDDAAVWGQNDNGLGVLAVSKNHTYKSSSNSTRVAIKGKGGAFFNTTPQDYWRMPGVLWCARVNPSGNVTQQWGDGISTVRVRKVYDGHYRVDFGNDRPVVYFPLVVADEHNWHGNAFVMSTNSDGFNYSTVDTSKGHQAMWSVIAILGVPRIK